MSSPSLWVPQSIYDKAKKLLTNNSNGNDIRDGVELVLQNDLEKILDDQTSDDELNKMAEIELTNLKFLTFDPSAMNFQWG